MQATIRKFRRTALSAAVLSTLLPLQFQPLQARAADLNTSLPADAGSNAPLTVDLPSQPLDTSLKQLAGSAGLSLAFDSALARDKIAPSVKGLMSRKEALRRLLSGSGLEAQIEDGNVVIMQAKPKLGGALPGIELEAINVRAKRFYEVGPLPGLGLTKEEIPGNIQSITAEDIKNSNALGITDLLNSKLQSINVNDYQGNPFQMDVTYRGFTAGPQIGTPQGLAVFFDGIRVNEPFGDVVNWDMIPMNALAGLDVIPGSNPIYGLGALGGAIAVKTKDGFNFTGVDAEVLTGSFGRKQLQASGGWNNGKVALFGAGSFFMEDGWRENSPSEVNQMFGKASYRGEKLDLNLSTLVVWNDLIGNGLLPSEMYKQNRNGVFTSPDTTDNRLWQFQLSSSYFVNDNFSITGQVYRRNSKRHNLGADVYTEFEGQLGRRNLKPGEEYTCLFESTNSYGLPDYYVVDIPNGDINEIFTNDPTNPFVSFLFSPTIEDAFAALPASWLNQDLPPELVARAQNAFAYHKNLTQTNLYNPGGFSQTELPNGEHRPYSNGGSWFSYPGQDLAFVNTTDPISHYSQAMLSSYYYTEDVDGGAGTLHLLLIKPPTNADTCVGGGGLGSELYTGPGNTPEFVDGSRANGTGPGIVDGTPTAVLTDSQIDQITDGASIQFNWNFDKHKFMVGASIDAPGADYTTSQRLGLFDADREAYLAPDEIRDQYAAASTPISNNNFEGSQITKSIYGSETWSPIETLHITGAARYNETRGKNKIASRTYGTFVPNLAEYVAFPDYYDICTPGQECPTGYEVPDASNLLHPPETEKFSYYSLNPSLGISWQAKPSLNVYGNWAQGTRVPSVIELGCAFDDTPIYNTKGEYRGPKSLLENRSCSLPSNLSGDPYLPQIKAETFDIGMRGMWGDNIQWNIGAYRTDLKDDIYLVTFPGNRNFFDTIGNTRRQGIEAGIAGIFGKARLSLNYALTEATFQDSFWIASDSNSSSVENVFGNNNFGRAIQVNPGDRMPGVPLHNLNATLTYDITPKWQVGLTAVAHSMAYVRGNENNKHQKGVVVYESINVGQGNAVKQVPRRVTSNEGHTDGYMVFNFRTSYQLASEWRLGLLVNNIFDKEYFTAGQLGRNPFSPSIYGAIGPDGYNHNSADWLSTNFLAPGAPRGAWLSLRYEFDPRR